MASIRFKPEPGGVIIPGARFCEYVQASYTEQAVTTLLKDVLALGSEKLDAHLHQRSLRGKVVLDPATQKAKSMDVIWGSARYTYEMQHQMRQFTMQVWSTNGGGESVTATRYPDGSLGYLSRT